MKGCGRADPDSRAVATRRRSAPLTDALRASRRRPEDQQRTTEMPEPTRYGEAVWLQPYPDVLLEGIPDQAPGPKARQEAEEAIALAFIVG